jgi:N-sulfoglucosamine sulfohydrolase
MQATATTPMSETRKIFVGNNYNPVDLSKMNYFSLKNTFTLLAGIGSFSATGVLAEKSPNEKTVDTRPNIIYVITHDLGRFLGTYGAELETPELDRFAAQGATFLNAFAVTAGCTPSRVSVMTGRYPHQHGVVGTGRGWYLDAEELTIVDYLNEAGYLTVHAGFQHERAKPGWRPNDPTYVDPNSYQVDARRLGGFPGILAENVVDDAIHWLKNRDPEDERPFYFNIGIQETHASTFRGRLAEQYKRSEVYGIDDPASVWVPDCMPDNAYTREYFSRMWPCVRHLDREFGRLVRAVDELGLGENTIFIFTTDHGIFGSRHKMTVFDSGLEIAKLVRWPAKVRAGLRTDALISNIDVTPTLLEAAGAAIPEMVDGRSFLPLLLDENFEPAEMLFFEYHYHTKYDPIRAIRTPEYLYIHNFHPHAKYHYTPAEILAMPEPRRDGWPNNSVLGNTPFDHPSLSNWPDRPREQLYDLRRDPLQFNDVARNPEYASILNRLCAILDERMEAMNDPLLHGDIPDARTTITVD